MNVNSQIPFDDKLPEPSLESPDGFSHEELSDGDLQNPFSGSFSTSHARTRLLYVVAGGIV